jgi:acyl-CoA thioesterase-1
MRRRSSRWLAASRLAALWLLLTWGATVAMGAESTPVAEPPPACAVPPEILEAAPALPHLAAAIRRGKPVHILAIGGASTKGTAAGSPDNAYPHRLQLALQKRFPEVPITVINQGMPRQTARQMVRRFPSEISEDEPALIVWEVGITDAVRGVDLDEFAAALQAGIELAKNRAIDILLVDMQFSRRTTTVIDFDRYLDTIRRVGEMSGVAVFPRFALMRVWGEQKVFEYDDVPESARAQLAAQVYDCLGRALAKMIARGVQRDLPAEDAPAEAAPGGAR